MSSSGLIYAVIVGAWAAYLVPMWLRRQDELNEIRPTERFSTAIRLLSGRAAMERRAARALDERGAPPSRDSAGPSGGSGASDSAGATGGYGPAGGSGPSGGDSAVHPAVGPAGPAGEPGAASAAGASEETSLPETQRLQHQSVHPQPAVPSSAAHQPLSSGRAALLARRRRMVTILFAAFTLGMVAAAVGGLSWLWAPGIPAILFTLYIAHLRRQERRRYEIRLDRRRAAEAAQRLRERAAAQQAAVQPAPTPAVAGDDADQRRHALVEATDHDEWVDGLRHAATESEETWDPVPLPLPTYVTAPVAPRSTPALDLNAPDAWSAGRAVVPQEPHPKPRPRTPLFDQYADDPVSEPRPRAANE